MTNDPVLAERIRRLAPTLSDSDWPDVIARSGQPLLATTQRRPRSRSPRWLLVAALLVTIGLLTPVLAVSASRGWWFQQPHQNAHWWTSWPTPVTGSPAIIATGTAHGARWTGVVFLSQFRIPQRKAGAPITPASRDSVCFAMIVGNRSNHPQSTGCGVLHGIDGIHSGPAAAWITYANWSFPNPPMIAGAVTNSVAKVVLVLGPQPSHPSRKPTLITPRLTTVNAVGSGVKVFAASYPANAGIETVILLDNHGKIIERHNGG